MTIGPLEVATVGLETFGSATATSYGLEPVSSLCEPYPQEGPWLVRSVNRSL